jgi:hypothetical protein
MWPSLGVCARRGDYISIQFTASGRFAKGQPFCYNAARFAAPTARRKKRGSEHILFVERCMSQFAAFTDATRAFPCANPLPF